MVEMDIQKDKTESELQYNLVTASVLTLGSSPCSATYVTIKPRTNQYTSLCLSFHVSNIRVPITVKTLSRFVVQIKYFDRSCHLE